VYLWVGEAFLCAGIEKPVWQYDLRNPLSDLCWLREGCIVVRLFRYMRRKKLAVN
jgi:hypothetical protein